MSQPIEAGEDIVTGPIVPPPPPPPSDLLYAQDFVYQGCFRVPATGDYTFPGKGMCYNPAHDSLYIVGFEFDHTVAEISIPIPIAGAASQAALNTATTLQALIDPTEGSISVVSGGDRTAIGGVLIDSSKLIVTAYRYYDANGTQPLTHWSRNPNIHATGDYTGPVLVDAGTLGLRAGLVDGYMASIPAGWQSAFGGHTSLTGNCGLSIINRTSFGPGVFAFTPSQIGTTNPVPSTALVYYPQEHQTLGWYDIAAHPGAPNPNTTFNGTMQMGGVFFPANTHSVVFFGLLGLGIFRYGQGTSDPALDGLPVPGEGGVIYCFDPAFPLAKGEHAYPYAPYAWAYNASELAQVAAGTVNAWDVVPYAVWQVTGDFTPSFPRIYGVAWDQAGQRLFLAQTFGDGFNPLIHVYHLGAATATHTLTVVNGSGTGPYQNGAVVSITANTIAGQMFIEWTGATVANATAANTTITMGTSDVTVTAVFVATTSFFVSTTGNNGNPGTFALPWRDIAYGANHATNVLVREGIYDESITSMPSGTSWNDTIRIAAYNGETVWMTPSSGTSVVQLGSDEHYIDFDAINMDGRNVSSMTFLLFPGDPHHIRIQNAELIGSPNAGGCATICGGRDCEILNNVIHGGGVGGGCGPLCANLGWYSGGPRNLVDGNKIYDTSEAGIQIYAPGGGADNSIIRNNRIHGVIRGGYNNPGATIVGILVASGDGNQVYNNLVYGCGVPAGSSTNAGINVFGAGCTNTLVFDNTLYGNFQYGISIQNSVGTVLRNNICYGNANDTPFDSGTGTVQDHNLFGTNPLWVDPANGDFHIQAGSPARGAGIGIVGIATDFYGETRPTVGACDIGAAEFVP